MHNKFQNPGPLLLGGGLRFLHFALFEVELLSVHYYLTDTLVLIAMASLGFRLTRVGQMITQPVPDATPVEGKQPDAAKADEASDVVAAKLDSVVTELRAIGETVKAQQQRLARMEKRFGLPNSAPIGERPTRAEDEADVGWPLDLNRSLDRESVDKAISFHDV